MASDLIRALYQKGHCLLGLLAVGCALSSCATLQGSAKRGLVEGRYQLRQASWRWRGVYLAEERDDTLKVLGTDTARPGAVRLVAPLEVRQALPAFTLRQRSLDLDVVTVPVKFRPEVGGVPPQLNTQVNAALYVGLRTDRYRLFYRQRHGEGSARRFATHVGYSLGGVAGLGSAQIGPTVIRRSGFAQEYEGVVAHGGAALLLGLNQVTAGVVIGWDYLLDRNRRDWIYQQRPWIGVAVGLNVN